MDNDLAEVTSSGRTNVCEWLIDWSTSCCVCVQAFSFVRWRRTVRRLSTRRRPAAASWTCRRSWKPPSSAGDERLKRTIQTTMTTTTPAGTMTHDGMLAYFLRSLSSAVHPTQLRAFAYFVMPAAQEKYATNGRKYATAKAQGHKRCQFLCSVSSGLRPTQRVAYGWGDMRVLPPPH